MEDTAWLDIPRWDILWWGTQGWASHGGTPPDGHPVVVAPMRCWQPEAGRPEDLGGWRHTSGGTCGWGHLEGGVPWVGIEPRWWHVKVGFYGAVTPDVEFYGAVPLGFGVLWGSDSCRFGFYGMVAPGGWVLWGGDPWIWGSMGRCPLDAGLYGVVPPGCGALWVSAPCMWGSMGQ